MKPLSARPGLRSVVKIGTVATSGDGTTVPISPSAKSASSGVR